MYLVHTKLMISNHIFLDVTLRLDGQVLRTLQVCRTCRPARLDRHFYPATTIMSCQATAVSQLRLSSASLICFCPAWLELRHGDSSYRDDGEHRVGLCVPEEDVDEGDDLQRLAQAHAVGQDAAEAATAAESLQRLHQVVVQEADPAHLRTDTVNNREKKMAESEQDQ